ncbi:MAG: glycosyltransferase family 4 protein [Planctomycetes bacterium]|nr:glycosyltransferase family 4 protein [Planctomycetota bacterium]
MRILIVSPGSLAVPGGNTSSILRLQVGLRGLGHEVQTCDAGAVDLAHYSPGQFDVVHGFHVRKGGLVALEIARVCGARLVVTLTGTETSLDWLDGERRAQVQGVLDRGALVIGLRASHLQELRELSGLPLCDAVVIPQTIHVGTGAFDLHGELGLDASQRLVLLPGGLRPVKAQDWAMLALESMGDSGTPWHLVLMGPVLDEAFADDLLTRVRAHGRAHYPGSISQESMGACYAACDLVLNTSETEGESNAVLEAMQAGRVVLARRNAGNAALIDDGRNGVLFETQAGLQEGLSKLLADGDLRGTLAGAAQEDVRARADLSLEIQAHLGAYQAAPIPGI